MVSRPNPWEKLSTESPFVLPEDKAAIEAFNRKQPKGSDYWINVESVIPQPFVGAVHTASVLVLQLNPGLDKVEDPIVHARDDFRNALFANLIHEKTDWPFYFFDPKFRDSTPGGKWWVRKTKGLIQELSKQRTEE